MNCPRPPFALSARRENVSPGGEKFGLTGWLIFSAVCLAQSFGAAQARGLRGVLVTSSPIIESQPASLKEAFNAIVLNLNETPKAELRQAIARIKQTGLDCYYWIEIARDPALNDVPVVTISSITDSEYTGHFPTDRPLHVHQFLDKPVPLRRLVEIATGFVQSDQPME